MGIAIGEVQIGFGGVVGSIRRVWWKRLWGRLGAVSWSGGRASCGWCLPLVWASGLWCLVTACVGGSLLALASGVVRVAGRGANRSLPAQPFCRRGRSWGVGQRRLWWGFFAA